MANSFAVTSLATEPLKLDPSGKAIVVFTVTNTTSKPLRGLAKAKALGNTKQEWLSIAGETERDFPAGGTQQFTVNFNPSATFPASAPLSAGKYEFRLNVASAINSDEDFTEGQVAAVEIPEIKQLDEKRLPIWMWLVPLILGIILIAFLIWFLTRKTSYDLPSVAGLKENEAKEKLEKNCQSSIPCATVSIQTENNDDVEKGVVIRSEPASGSKVRIGAAVTLHVSTGPEIFALRRVVGQEKDQAKKTLEEFCQSAKPCLNIEILTENSNLIKDGLVTRTDPAEGNPVTHNSKVNLFISAGPEMLVVQQYIGLPELNARTRIIQDGFSVGAVKHLPPLLPLLPNFNRVIEQSPSPGIKQPRGTPINLIIR